MKGMFFVFCLLVVAATECMLPVEPGFDNYRSICNSFLKGEYSEVAAQGLEFRDNTNNGLSYRRVIDLLFKEYKKLGEKSINLGEDNYATKSVSGLVGQRCTSLLMSGGDLDEIKELLAIERKLDPNSMTVWRNSIMLEQRETPLSDILARTISTHSISTHSISTRSISTDGLAKWKAIFGGASE